MCFGSRNAEKEEAIMSTLLQERQQPITAPRLRDRVAAEHATPRASARHQPAPTVANCPVDAPRARWRVILGSIVATLREWRRRRVGRRELARPDERPLRPSAGCPTTVHDELRQAVWR